MTVKEVAKAYITHLASGKIDELLGLFTDDALVDSPLYGLQKAVDFFTKLTGDTTSSTLTIHGIFEKESVNEVALYFEYLWHLKNGTSVTFDVVDIMQFTNENKISHLKIIYDTVQARPLLEQQNL